MYCIILYLLKVLYKKILGRREYFLGGDKMAGKELKGGKKRGMYLAGNKRREKNGGNGKVFWAGIWNFPTGMAHFSIMWQGNFKNL